MLDNPVGFWKVKEQVVFSLNIPSLAPWLYSG